MARVIKGGDTIFGKYSLHILLYLLTQGGVLRSLRIFEYNSSPLTSYSFILFTLGLYYLIHWYHLFGIRQSWMSHLLTRS
jgi:hypothetical protein